MKRLESLQKDDIRFQVQHHEWKRYDMEEVVEIERVFT
jgi:hypothetical protein